MSSTTQEAAAAPTQQPSSTPGAATQQLATAWVAGYTHLGCFSDSARRILPMATGLCCGGDTKMRPDICRDHCTVRGFPMFGLQYGTQCFCGSSLEAPARTADNVGDCNFECPGQPGDACGGFWRMNVYAPTTESKTTQTTAATTSHAAGETGQQSAGLSAGAIAGIAIGAAAVVIAVVVGLVLMILRRRRRENSGQLPPTVAADDEHSPSEERKHAATPAPVYQQHVQLAEMSPYPSPSTLSELASPPRPVSELEAFPVTLPQQGRRV